MKAYYDAIYLSPHLDDAALSCGGQIYQQTQAGQSVLIVNITAGDPPGESEQFEFARFQHQGWDLAVDPIAARRAEDEKARQILGADSIYWPFPDCIYRAHPETGAPLYTSDPEIFGEVDPVEAPLLAQLIEQMQTLPPHGKLLVPLTAGHHVDHQLTRAAAERVFGAELLYYEESPYTLEPLAVERALASQPEWRLRIIPLNEAAITARIKATAAFHSQLKTLFGDENRMAQLVRQQIAALGGERIWQRLVPSSRSLNRPGAV